MKDKEDTNENMRDREKGMINLNFAGIRSREELYRYCLLYTSRCV